MRCGLEEMTNHTLYYCEQVCMFWDYIGEVTACINPKQLLLLDVGYAVDNVSPHGQMRNV